MKSRSRELRLAVALSILALSGCGDDEPRFDHLQYQNVSSAPGVTSLRPLEIRIQHGLAVKARVSAIGDDGKPMDLLEMYSQNPEIFGVAPGPELGNYVFYGVSPGNAELDVFSRGRFQASLPVTVTPQSDYRATSRRGSR